MNNNYTVTPALLVFLSTLFASSVQAAAGESYIGFGYGTTSTETGVTPVTASLDEDDSGFKLFGGHQMNDNLAIEGFYADLGEATVSGDAGDTFIYGGILYQFLVNNGKLAYEGTVLGANALLSLPVSDSFSLFGKLGMALWEVDVTASGSGISSSSASDDGTDFFYGVGASYRFNQDWSVRGEYDMYNFDDGDVDMLSVNIVKWF